MNDQLRKSITTLVFVLYGLAAAGAWAQVPKTPLAVKPDAPDRYVVVPGDTLWGISERFTDSPWRWPELWNMNKDQIKNPHRIYPGNIIVLDRTAGQLALETLKLTPRVRAESTAKDAIPSIPPQDIEPFLSRPLVIEPDGLERAPSIVAAEEGRVVLGNGNKAYVAGIGQGADSNWFIYRPGGPLVDPDTNLTLGYEATYLGTARVTRPGEPAVVELTTVTQEVSIGDRLVPAGKAVPVSYMPHAPAVHLQGRVMTVYGGTGRVGEAGNQAIISINRGAADGLEPGHVLALYNAGVELAAGYRARITGTAPIVLPAERYGLVFVFRVFERVSYALVMRIERPVQPLDVVQTP